MPERRDAPAAANKRDGRVRRIWPWSAIDRLAVELRATRLACSASDKRANRLASRIAKLDGALVRHRAQARHDQGYIDALEARLDSASIEAARSEVSRGEGASVDEALPLWPQAICANCNSVATLTDDLELDDEDHALCPTCGHTTFSSAGVPLP